MTIDRAYEINSLLIQHGMFDVNPNCDPLPPGLESVGLDEMLEATNLVRANGSVKVGNETTYTMVCDHRVIAAIYCAYHFHPGRGDEIHAVAKSADGRMVVVIQAKK